MQRQHAHGVDPGQIKVPRKAPHRRRQRLPVVPGKLQLPGGAARRDAKPTLARGGCRRDLLLVPQPGQLPVLIRAPRVTGQHHDPALRHGEGKLRHEATRLAGP
jgi:hypothetical protein